MLGSRIGLSGDYSVAASVYELPDAHDDTTRMVLELQDESLERTRQRAGERALGPTAEIDLQVCLPPRSCQGVIRRCACDTRPAQGALRDLRFRPALGWRGRPRRCRRHDRGCSGHAAPHAASASPARASHPSRFPLVVATRSRRGSRRQSTLTAGSQLSRYPVRGPPVADFAGGLRSRSPPGPGFVQPTSTARCAQPIERRRPRFRPARTACLSTCSARSRRVRQRLPVYVYIHGGGLMTGDGSYFDMRQIVRETGVIGVTFNYRLGVFGFLAHPGLDTEHGESGNYGFLDQQAALRWLHRNVAAFGGDPSRVTIGGESAGGWSVCAHLIAPHSRGLFAQAVIQSGSCQTETARSGHATGSGFAADAGCSSANPADARVPPGPSGGCPRPRRERLGFHAASRARTRAR